MPIPTYFTVLPASCLSMQQEQTRLGLASGCRRPGRTPARPSKRQPACSLGVKPILSKCADCRSPADGGVHARGGVAVEKDDDHQRSEAAHGRLLAAKAGASEPTS